MRSLRTARDTTAQVLLVANAVVEARANGGSLASGSHNESDESESLHVVEFVKVTMKPLESLRDVSSARQAFIRLFQ